MIIRIKKCCAVLKAIGYGQHQIDEITRFCVGAKALLNLDEKECVFLLANLEKHIELANKFINC